jgi:hypothetical protein
MIHTHGRPIFTNYEFLKMYGSRLMSSASVPVARNVRLHKCDRARLIGNCRYSGF